MEIDLTVNVSSIISAEGDDLTTLGIPLVEAIFALVSMSLVTVCTVVGNVLVILSVFTYKPLRIAQNFFLVSLAFADLTVALLVLPFNIAQTLMGRWTFGVVICEMWLTCDVLCCTASILNLCAIALDRYWAIHDPINYAQKRTLKRVVVMIILVWVISGVICLPPVIGWNDWTPDFNEYSKCRLTSQQGYVIYSSCGSFYIPLVVMTTVYVKIFVATKRRLRERAKKAAAMSVVHGQSNSGKYGKSPEKTSSSVSPKEANHNDATCDDVMDSNGGSPTTTTELQLPLAHHHSSAPALPSSHHMLMLCAEESVSEVQHRLHKVDSKTSEHSPIHQFIEERQKISLSKERRAARILGIVMGVFVVCWLPFFLMYLVVPFCSRLCAVSSRIENFITWLGYINSALNPIIYTIFNIDFRRAFSRLLHCTSFL